MFTTLDLDRPTPVRVKARAYARHVCVECLPGCLIVHALLHLIGVT